MDKAKDSAAAAAIIRDQTREHGTAITRAAARATTADHAITANSPDTLRPIVRSCNGSNNNYKTYSVTIVRVGGTDRAIAQRAKAKAREQLMKSVATATDGQRRKAPKCHQEN